jgi:hypothetical protein
MAITVKHSKVSTIPDEADTSLVRPSDWNADHTLTGTIDIANGGTGQTTANAAFNALIPSQTGNTGKYLTTNGTDTSWATNPLGTVTSVNLTASTGISVSGGPITTSGSITVTNTAPDQTVVLNAGTGISTSGTYPNFTITNTNPSLGGDVVGPASSTDNAIARFDTTTGKLLQNSVVTVGDTGAVSGVTTLSASTSVTTPIVQATNSAGLSLRNSAGTTQISMGGGGGDNVTIAVATNINGANAQIDISPTGTGHVHIKPTGTGSLEIAPTNVGTINNMSVGATTASTGAFTTLSASGTTTLNGNQIISVTDNSNAALRITQLGTGNALLVEDSSNPDSTPFVITNAGNVGIGTTASSFPLTVEVPTEATTAAVFRIAQSATPTGEWNALQINANAQSIEQPVHLNWDWDSIANGVSIAGVKESTTAARLQFYTMTGDVKSERIRIGSVGQFGIGGANYGTSGQVLTSGGASAAPSWTTPTTGTVTSVGGTGTVSGISLSGTVTSTGNLTLGGTLDLSSPPVIGNTTPAAITGTTITATTFVGVSGGTF